MKTRYTFIHSVGAITTDTVFYTVMLGTSQEDKAILRKSQSLRFTTDCYFQPYTQDVATFVRRIAESLYPDVTFPLLRLNHQVLNGRQFRQLLEQKVFTKQPSPKGTAHTLCQLESIFHYKHPRL